MGIFRKKQKEKTINKKLVIAIEVSCAVLLFLTLLGIKWLITNKAPDQNIVTLENQTVENVSFVDFKVEYVDEEGNVSVGAINYTDTKIEVKNLKIRMYAEDNNLVSQIEVPAFVLETNQEHLIENKILTSSKISSVEYIIE